MFTERLLSQTSLKKFERSFLMCITFELFEHNSFNNLKPQPLSKFYKVHLTVM